MKSSLGNPARGEQYFIRLSVIEEIYQNLNNHLYLSAPRRMGKTSTFHYLVENPRKGFLFLYFNGEALDNSTSFFKQLLEAVENNEQIKERLTYRYQLQRVLHDVLHLLEQVNLGSLFEITLHEPAKIRYYQTFYALLELLEKSKLTIVLLIDEFPQTIVNIQENYSKQKARQFLQIHRTLRSDCGPNMRFVYTGSIGLQQVVNRLGATNHMNDLTTVSLPPLTDSEAHALATALFKHHQTPLHPTAIDDLIKRLKYLVPYHLQLLVDRLTQKYKTTKQIIDNEVIEQVFNQLCEEQHTTLSLHYYDRLPRTFAKNDLLFAKAMLNAMAQQETINTTEVQALAQTLTPKPACNWVLATLIHDGYMIESKGYYYYLSPILRKWWQKYGMD